MVVFENVHRIWVTLGSIGVQDHCDDIVRPLDRMDDQVLGQ